MKQINFKIKKGHVSYIWRGNGSRLLKAIFKQSNYIKIKTTKDGRFIQSNG
jgi:hypothetical protein